MCVNKLDAHAITHCEEMAEQLGEGVTGQPAKRQRVRRQLTKKEIDWVCKRVSLYTNTNLQGVIGHVEASSKENKLRHLLAQPWEFTVYPGMQETRVLKI